MQKVPMAWDAARGLLVSGWVSLRADLRWEMPKVELGVVVSRRVTGSAQRQKLKLQEGAC